MKKILLTGATDGIGLSAAKMLAQEGHILLLHGRNPQRLSALKEELAPYSSSIFLYQADLSEKKQVLDMITAIKKDHTHLDVLINNAGVYVLPEENRVCGEGIDTRIMVNAVAPYLLAQGLLPLLTETSRVVNVASAAQMTIDMNKLRNHSPYSHDEAYAQSKMTLIIWTMELAERHPTLFVSVNPKSFLGSKMVHEAYGKEGFDLNIGGDILCRAALSPEFATASGQYYCNDTETFRPPNAFAENPENRRKIMAFLEEFESM